MFKFLKLRKKKKKIVYLFYHASNLMINHYSLSTISAIVQNTIFTFTFDGERLKKTLFVIIMNEKNTNMFHNFTLDD